VIDGEKILITGATGKIAFPIARSLAKRNEVWGAARLSKPETVTGLRRGPGVPDRANYSVLTVPACICRRSKSARKSMVGRVPCSNACVKISGNR
jgi:nucleoside-diphosphate-sugar epimerase